MKITSYILSYIFHPIFVILYSLILIFICNPYIFSIEDPKDKVVIITLITMLTVGFPLLSIFLIRFLGLNKDLNMDSRQERVVPLVITAMFYLWLFVNIKNNTYVPLLFTSFVLGATISIFVAFFINNFSKISLHTVGMGGLVCILILLQVNFNYSDFILNLGPLGTYHVYLNLLILIGIMIAGSVGAARLYLTDHSKTDIYGGYLVGILSQVMSYIFLF